MSDILATFAILLAVFTYIESLFHNSIDNGINMEVKLHKRDNKSNYEKVKKIILNHQSPLVLISFIISLIIAPVSIEILNKSLSYISMGIAKYDISSISIILLNIIFVIICIKEIITFYKLLKKLKKLRYW